jgi:hypothetical protein
LLGFKNCIGGVKNGNLKAAATRQAARLVNQSDSPGDGLMMSRSDLTAKIDYKPCGEPWYRV